jgi:hypothetical protein
MCDPALRVCLKRPDGRDAAPQDAGAPKDTGDQDQGMTTPDLGPTTDVPEFPLDASWPDLSWADAGTDEAGPDASGDDATPDGSIDAGDPCANVDETLCIIGGCQAHYCTGCNNGHSFSGCTSVGGLDPFCPVPVCNPGCQNAMDEQSCLQTGMCHPVYLHVEGCNCMMYSFCADGAHAVCQGTVQCNTPPPICDGEFRVSYRSPCWEGCVLPQECGP